MNNIPTVGDPRDWDVIITVKFIYIDFNFFG